MKSSNPLVMVQAYRLLVKTMQDEFGVCYPLHLGVTEAGDGEDGRIKSAIGIGTLLEDGIGDTIRVSLTEDPEFEIPVCRDLVKRYAFRNATSVVGIPPIESLPYSPLEYKRRVSFAVDRVGGKQVPVVVADLSKTDLSLPSSLQAVGYTYDAATDKWSIADAAADYVFTGNQLLPYAIPGTLKLIAYPDACQQANDPVHYTPIYEAAGYLQASDRHATLNWVMLDCFSDETSVNDFTNLEELANDPTVVLCLSSRRENAMQAVRRMFVELMDRGIENPVVLLTDSSAQTPDDHLIHFATETGALLLDGMGDGVCLGYTSLAGIDNTQVKGRTYLPVQNLDQFTNNTAFSILQATRTRISKTEYISCPSCGRTLFDLQETTAKIRSVTHHLKGLKIAIMGCIVNGPGEMADADFGYVGSGPGKITLYKGKEVVKKNVNSEIAVEELINLLKEEGVWHEI
jgi:(E)-4-hydroxy-3-methylbut-2-enyl-diphosphate synthase